MTEILDTIAGAFFLILFWWKVEKEKRDNDPKYAKKHTWEQFFWKNIDDVVWALACGVMLGVYREQLVYLGIYLRDWNPDNTWNIYYDLEYLILFSFGFFGTLIVKGLIELGMFTIKKVTRIIAKLNE